MQIRCGDLYADKAIEAFNSCAVSDKKCVPQKVDKDVFPVPQDSALDQKFDLSQFQVFPKLLMASPSLSKLHHFQGSCEMITTLFLEEALIRVSILNGAIYNLVRFDTGLILRHSPSFAFVPCWAPWVMRTDLKVVDQNVFWRREVHQCYYLLVKALAALNKTACIWLHCIRNISFLSVSCQLFCTTGLQSRWIAQSFWLQLFFLCEISSIGVHVTGQVVHHSRAEPLIWSIWLPRALLWCARTR